MRHVPDHLERAIEQPRHGIRHAIQETEYKSDGSAKRESGGRARSADRDVTAQFARLRHPYRRSHNIAWRGQNACRNQPDLSRDLPNQQKNDGQYPWQQVANESLHYSL